MSEDIKKTLDERGSRYGTFEGNAAVTQDLMFIVSQAPSFSRWTNEHKEAVHMIFHKIARMANGDPMYQDNVHDIIGYAKLLENFIERENDAKNTGHQASIC